ncbi:MAG: extensin family protein [Deltaproteobacteria bacterium]|nr:extensin family protein [Deltaproteobacteria bacterium]
MPIAPPIAAARPPPVSSPATPVLRRLATLLLAVACSRGSPPSPVPTDAAAGRTAIPERAEAGLPLLADAAPPGLPPSDDAAAPRPAPEAVAGPPATPPDSPPPRPPGSMADLDPTNDRVTGPPDPVLDCESRLEAAGVRWAPASLPVRRRPNGDVCGVEQAVTYREGPTGIRWSPHPVVSCGLALALARLETVAQQEAERLLGSRITRIEQGGTTACRRIARFPGMMSEHSFANGIDVRSFKLADGRTVAVQRWFGDTAAEPAIPEGRFLRTLARRLYDEDVFSVVLTAFWDSLHDDHFHLDLARYRVDGTR